MTDYMHPDLLKSIVQDRPLPVAQGFIDSINDEAQRNPESATVDAVAKAAVVAIASLELKLGKLMDALGARETTVTPGNWQIEKIED